MILDDILKILKSNSNNKAYTIGDKSYTYSELYKYVCNIYYYLLEKNINKLPVIVYGHKDVYMKATFIACSFAGITYVPIDESMPIDRVKLIINQVKPSLVIGNVGVSNYENITEEQIEKIMYNNKVKEINKIYMKEENIYYIIFTSGSTGIPKGVRVTYKNINSCINWLKDITKAEKEVILNQANFSFDLSVADLYLSLVSESEHYILENENKTDFTKLFKELNISNATLAVMTPSFADLLLLDKSFNDELMPNLKTIIFCGEKLLKSTIDKLYERFKKLKIINSYGPTECTFAVTSIEILRNTSDLNEIPVGKVKSDCKITIVDKELKPVKEGDIGEILIIGKSVADGYVEESKNINFITCDNERAYLTGDLGYIENECLYYKCRKDKQVKYKGYRIELSDIERNLQDFNYIEKAVVVAKQDKNNKTSRLIAFVKIKENMKKSVLDIKEDLKKKIPEYMCPAIKIIKDFPINQNGKCDEKKLLEEY
jgi:D-alanine--poly(phosphoribitol) ligase subunit 1